VRTTSQNKRKVYILSINERCVFFDFLSFSINDIVKDYAYSKFSITELEEFSPNAIIIDNYYTRYNYNLIIATILKKFPTTQIFVLSPEKNKYNDISNSKNSEIHYFSYLNENIINRISSTQGNDPSSYLTAC